jgi:hexosaminidase
MIPAPLVYQPSTGTFVLGPATSMIASDASKTTAALLADQLRTATSFTLPGSTDTGASNVIALTCTGGDSDDESYTLDVTPEGVRIQAKTDAGIFYATRTLLQLLPPQVFSPTPVTNVEWAIPCCHIEDAPRFKWRGLMLDCCRHFFPVEFVKRYIDLLALHKFNRFHWHLTEDQGWRIAVDKYPKLTEIAAWRTEKDGSRYGGFYTKDEMRDVVAYAAARHVTVVPEIEMPGHCTAALAAYPELSCTGGPFEVPARWGVFKEVYCAGNDEVFTFLENVLDEVLAIFPGEFIHVGGDECPKERWKECPKCQARIKAEGLEDEHGLQSYFIRRIEKHINAKGRRLIGWDEILEGGLAPNATVMSWRGIQGGIASARQGHDAVMCPGTHCYFDFYQSEDRDNEPHAIGGFTPVDKTYSYEPVPEELNADEARHILGVQGNVWTEYIATTDHVEYMAYPRACALAEVAWSPKEKRNWDDFSTRLAAHLARLDELSVNYRPQQK